ncbi:Cell division protein FtsZ [hydrothermal vent metagenome]|uniref:Cell division protein FtsZ n=1 Tax=hydrothermal vent metagenome TaxID=652676 RepID=A0A3B0RGE5_9ZZZZ
MTIEFTTTELTELTPKITVFGVGGAGGNAVNNMIDTGLEGVDFVVANTDAQALAYSRAEQKIQLGAKLTQGLGAGARPEVGRAAAEETIDLIREHLRDCHMTFITAGMGGGTGTGAAPIIAQTAREEGILTVGVITKPFQFEGNRRMALAEQGIKELSQYVDTLIIIPNQNLFRIANERTTFADAFAMADEVLHSGVRGITDLMVLPGLVNLDFADVRTVMSEMGKAMMGTGEAEGDNRALEAAEAAISNPLLDEVSMKGANGVLINITGGMDLTLFEVDEAANRIRSEVDPEANILVGSALNPDLDGKMRVSVVATGIESDGNNRREEPRKTYSFDSKPESKPQTSEASSGDWDEPIAERRSLVETAMDTEAVVQNAEPETLELVDEVKNVPEDDKSVIQRETDKILAQLAEGIVQNPAEPDSAELVARREDPFIAAAPVMPEKRMEPLAQQADVFAEAAMANAPVEKEAPRKKGFLDFLTPKRKPVKKQALPPRQPDLLSPEEPVLTTDAVETSAPEVKTKPLIADEPVQPTEPAIKESDHLEIPAFLRRQAN